MRNDRVTFGGGTQDGSAQPRPAPAGWLPFMSGTECSGNGIGTVSLNAQSSVRPSHSNVNATAGMFVGDIWCFGRSICSVGGYMSQNRLGICQGRCGRWMPQAKKKGFPRADAYSMSLIVA